MRRQTPWTISVPQKRMGMLAKRTSAKPSSKEAILDAAERVFATHGYDGTSMRLIAREAGVAQALLHYHFSTKDRLYEAIFARRSTAINAFRSERLQRLFAGRRQPKLEEVLDVMFQPSPNFLGSETQPGTYFAPMVSAISIGQDRRSKSLMKRYYDPIARSFIGSFRRVCPGLSEKDAVWAYLFALGARLQANRQNDRALRLGGKAAAIDDAGLRAEFINFVSGGIRSLSRRKSSSSPGKRRSAPLASNPE
jgi:AcrR family transcriptional regulator